MEYHTGFITDEVLLRVLDKYTVEDLITILDIDLEEFVYYFSEQIKDNAELLEVL